MLFPPNTQEVQFDEKWSFVAKKEKHCDRADPIDEHKGECWDHIAFDPEHRLVLSVVVGKRTAANVAAVVKDFYARTEGRLMRLITTDEYSCYETAILEAYGQTVVPERTGRPGRPKAPYKVAPEELCYATVRKTRKKGRVEEIIVRAVFGSLEMIEAALKHSSRVSRAVNTAFIERYNGTDRNFNARKVRKTYCFSKDWQVHEALTYFSMYSYNFCWEVRTLGKPDGEGRRRQGRTPAMAAGLADDVWSLKEWLSFPTVQYI